MAAHERQSQAQFQRQLASIVALGIVFGICGHSAGQSPLRYGLSPLDPFPGTAQAQVHSINDLGEVAGWAEIFVNNAAVHNSLPLVWRDGIADRIWSDSNALQCASSGPEGHFSLICEPSTSLEFAFPGGYAYAINNAGQVVGHTRGNAGIPELVIGIQNGRAFFWDSDEGRIDLGTLGGPNSEARDINNYGLVAGSSQLPAVTVDGISASFSHAFVWDAAGGLFDIGTLHGGPFESTRATAINDLGQIVGFGHDYYSGNYAFLWDPETGMAEIGQDMIPVDLNDHGYVVIRGGFVWTPDAGFKSIEIPEGFRGAGGNAINNSNEVVGKLSDGGHGRAIYWSEERGTIDLNDLLPDGSGWVLHAATDINENGQIVGWGRYHGEYREFLLSPVPEPSSLFLLCVGALATLAKRPRCKRPRRI